MARQRLVDSDLAEAKRRLRSQTARLRRHVGDRLVAIERETSRLTSWRTYVRRFPLAAVAAAFGVGLAASAGISRTRWSAWLARQMVASAAGAVRTALGSELAALWARGHTAGKTSR